MGFLSTLGGYFGSITNTLSTVSLPNGTTASTYRSNPQALKDYLELSAALPRDVGRSLAQT